LGFAADERELVERLVPADERLVPDDERELAAFGFAADERELAALGFAAADRVLVERLARDDDVLVAGVARPAAPRAAPVTRERAPDSSSATRAASVSSWLRNSRTSSTTRRSSMVWRMRPVAAETWSTTSRWRFSVSPALSSVRSMALRMASMPSAAAPPDLSFFACLSFFAMARV
jgi:hypothetical protein